MDEAARELPLLVAGRDARGPHEIAVGVSVVPPPQVGLAEVESALEGGRRRRPLLLLYALVSHEKPSGLAGGWSGLRSRPGVGSGAL